MNVDRRLRVVDAKRRDILEAAAALSPAELAARPAPTAWSVLQIIEHLLLAEAGVMVTWPRPSGGLTVDGSCVTWCAMRS